MSLELGLIFILFVGVVLNGIIDWKFEAGQDERIKQLDDHNDWQDSERARLRERIVEIEKLLQEIYNAVYDEKAKEETEEESALKKYLCKVQDAATQLVKDLGFKEGENQ